ncbi:MAG: hypothetical protein JWO91_473 [Acidobacteriaceae bacterium]|nr:hypothetical protein [Acidobacteriaceae bacterium]
MRRKMVESTLSLVSLLLLAAGLASGQTELQPPTAVGTLPPPGARVNQVSVNGDNAVGFSFVAAEPVSTKVVKGAPYSAEATIESTQTLSDGNRIVHRQKVHLYRDSEGRTRREETLAAIGPWAAQGTPATIVTIQDPKSGAAYVLDTQNKTAQRLPGPMGMPPRFGTARGGVTSGGPVLVTRSGTNENSERDEMYMPIIADGNAVATSPMRVEGPGVSSRGEVASFGPGFVPAQGDPIDKKVSSLGREEIAGVPASGTRTSITIPANAIGNEQPLTIVNEKWLSQELQIVLRTKESDPRFGETAYEVTTLDRGEPSHALFTVPTDYKVIKAPTMTFRSGGEPK